MWRWSGEVGVVGVKRWMVLILLAPFALAAAPQLTLPSTRLQPVAPQLSKTPAPTPTPSRVSPAITGFNPIGCYVKGARFNILGRGFGGVQGTRTAALRGKGLSLALIIDGWSDSRIRARIPDDPRLVAGQWYSVGIAADQGQWLSKLDHNLQLCEATVTPETSLLPTTTLSTSKSPITPPAGPQSPPAPGGVMPGTNGQQTGETTPAGQTQNLPAQSAGGSLLGQALPPPPQITAYAEDSEDDQTSEPDEVMVVSPDLPQAERVRQLAQGLGLGIKRRSVLRGLDLVVSVFRVPAGVSPRDLVRQLRAQDPELWVDLDHRFTLQGGDARTYPARMLGWPERSGDCGKGLRIGLVDGPLPEADPALAGAAIEYRSFVTHGLTPGPTDHALAIAAILVGSEGRGLTAGARLFDAEVMRQRDEDHVDTTVDWLVQGLDWLVVQRVDLINLSLGGPRNLILDAAIQRLQDLDIPVVAAAGNQGPEGSPVYPAATPGVIAVTAIDAERHLYPRANRGDYIAFAAPGVDIWVPRGGDSAYVSGTSFAAPYVTALLAARRQGQPQASWQEDLQALIDSALDLGDPGRDDRFGYGLPQAQGICGGP
ncbi:MAG: S8 family serine peptidase [Candidatus Thiodiazotropha sp.]